MITGTGFGATQGGSVVTLNGAPITVSSWSDTSISLTIPSAATTGPLVVTVGLDELPELIRQSEEFAAAWQKRGLRGRYLPLPGHDHFSIVDELATPDGQLVAALKELARA